MSSFIEFPQPDEATVEKSRAYFEGRLNYTRVEGGYSYENQDTDCHFIVDTETPQTDENGDGATGQAIAFSLNYVRPKPFIREAVAEVVAFNSNFPGLFRNEETGQLEAFDSDRYIAAWTSTNDLFARQFSKEEGTSSFFAPSATVQQVWKWNTELQNHQNQKDEETFVSKAMWMATGVGRAVPAIIWSEGVVTVFPAFAERLVLVTKPTKHPSLLNRLFGRTSQPEFITRVLPSKTLMADLKSEPAVVRGIPSYSSEAVFPAAVLKALDAVEPIAQEDLNLISSHLVLEAEILTD
jgi:hypothetical protein